MQSKIHILQILFLLIQPLILTFKKKLFLQAHVCNMICKNLTMQALCLAAKLIGKKENADFSPLPTSSASAE